MRDLMMIGLGGALGAICRHGFSSASRRLLGDGFPFGTLGANVLGSFAMALLAGLALRGVALPAETRLLLATGFLGAFTTFSTFSLDFWLLIERGRLLTAALYALLSVGLALLAFGMGWSLMRR